AHHHKYKRPKTQAVNNFLTGFTGFFKVAQASLPESDMFRCMNITTKDTKSTNKDKGFPIDDSNHRVYDSAM
ncbi:MAG: hypothetical protein ACYTCV_10345, partial [Planctomycetota bacterium]